MTHLFCRLARLSQGHALTVHATGVLRRHRTYLFLGSSGGGKSTLARLCDGMAFSVLGDDGVLILEDGTDFYVRPLPRQARVPPAPIPVGPETRPSGAFFLEKAPEPRGESIPVLEAIARCLKEDLLFGFRDMTSTERLPVLDRCIRFFRRVPTYVLYFARDNRFWDVIDELEGLERASPAR